MLPRFIPWLAALLATLPATVFAWQDCPPAGEVGGVARFHCLLSHEVQLTGHLDYELALADAARHAGDPTYAAIVLERVVARHPLQAGARLDLVIVSLDIGDNLTAARHLAVLRATPNPPPLVIALIQRLEQSLKPADKSFDTRPRFQGTVGLGYDTNPNLGVVADAIDLIINGSPLTLVPDGSLAPQAAFFAGASAGVEYSYSAKGLLSASGMVREYEGLSNEDSYAVTANLYHFLRDNRHLEAVVADFRTSEGLYLSRIGLGARQHLGHCRCSTLGVLVDHLRGSEASTEATRLRLELETTRELGLARFMLSSSVGYDHQPEAGWGDTLGLRLGGDALVQMGKVKGSMGLSLYKGWDDSPYSPLFGSRQRDLERGTVRLGLAYPVAEGAEVFVDWSYSRQQSGIVLFDYDRHVSALGLRLSF